MRTAWLNGAALLAVAIAIALVAVKNLSADSSHQILNISYDPTRELFQDLNPQFTEQYFKDTGKPRAFGLDYAHDVRNVSLAPAISIHAYSPPLNEMNEYELDGSQLVPRERPSGKAETLDQEWRVQSRKPQSGLVP
jgi:hypothetical protein